MGISSCFNLSRTCERENPWVKLSAKLLLGSNAMMPTTFEENMWEDGWEERVWIQNTPAGDALWNNQTWQAEAFTSAVISQQKSWMTHWVCSWHATVEEQAYVQAIREKLRWEWSEWARWLRLLYIPNKTGAALLCYGMAWLNVSWLKMHGECLLYLNTLHLGGLATELATGLAIAYIKGIGKNISLIKQFETDRFVWRSVLSVAS